MEGGSISALQCAGGVWVRGTGWARREAGVGLRKSRLTPPTSAAGIKANVDGGTLIGNSSTAFRAHLLAKWVEPGQTTALTESGCLFSLGQGELKPGQVPCPKHSAHPAAPLQADTEPACAKASVFVQRAATRRPVAARNKTKLLPTKSLPAALTAPEHHAAL